VPFIGFEMDLEAANIIDSEISKSQRKRDARVLFELGLKLVAMSSKELSALPIETDLREAIDLARSIKAHVARKRQVQFVAKMMRNRDVQAIQEALDAQELEARQMTVRHHRVEAWRDRLLKEGDDALAVFLSSVDTTEIQTLRHLVRNARKEQERNKPPATARKLFKLLREMDAAQDLPPA
jgi:ribosome-associated protein